MSSVSPTRVLEGAHGRNEGLGGVDSMGENECDCVILLSLLVSLNVVSIRGRVGVPKAVDLLRLSSLRRRAALLSGLAYFVRISGHS